MTLFPLPYYDFSIPVSFSAEEGVRRISDAIESGSIFSEEPELPSYTADQKALFRTQFLRRRRVAVGVSVATVLVVVAIPLYEKRLPEMLFGLGSSVWRFLAIVLFFALAGRMANLFYRCPACDRSLGRRFDWKACPGCGAPFSG